MRGAGVAGKLTSVDAPGVVTEAQRKRTAGRLAGALFLMGALTLVPSTRLLEPEPGPAIYLLTIVAVASGCACLLTPWDRLPAAALHLLPIAGALEVGLVVIAAGGEGRVYATMYILIAVWAAYVFSQRRYVIAHVAFALAAGATTFAVDDAFTRPTLLQLLVCVPIVLAATVMVTLAREHSDAREDAYRQLSERDPLTGVGNYRALHERMDYEILRHARHCRDLTVVVLDLDDFKGVNDRHGHAEGDRLLCRIGHALTRLVRGEDTVARQGGDEFSVLAPETTAAQAALLAARIEGRLGEIAAAGERVCVTLGWASFPSDGTTAEDLLTHADEMLRRRKASRAWIDESLR